MQTHIKHLGLENFRVFKERTDFEFAPITILTGTNSSGKSSLISAMELLNGINVKEHEIEQHGLIETIYPDIIKDISFLNSLRFAQANGDFSSIRNINGNEEIKFDFAVGSPLDDAGCRLSCSYTGRKEGIGFAHGVLKSITIDLINKDSETERLFFLEFDGSLYKMTLPWKQWYKIFQVKVKESKEKKGSNAAGNDNKPKSPIELVEAIWNTKALAIGGFLKKTSKEVIFFEENKEFLELTTGLRFRKDFEWMNRISAFCQAHEVELPLSLLDAATKDELLDEIQILLSHKLHQAFNNNDNLIIYSTSSELLQEIRFDNLIKVIMDEPVDLFTDYVFGFGLPVSFSDSDNGQAAKSFFSNFILRYVSTMLTEAFIPFRGINVLHTGRAITSRSIMIKDSRLIDNQMEQLVNLLFTSNAELQLHVAQSLNKYFSSEFLGICDEVVIRVSDSKDLVQVMLRKGRNWFNILDEGFGVNAVFSVVLLAAFVQNRLPTPINTINEQALNRFIFDDLQRPSIVVLEEPESNLHPALQSKLIDVFVDVAKNFNTQFIIETHSEYLIRKLQYLTAKGEIKPKDTAIYYFYPPDNVPPGETQVKRIDIDEDGYLSSDFGTGFFDESDKLAMSLWNYNKSQKN